MQYTYCTVLTCELFILAFIGCGTTSMEFDPPAGGDDEDDGLWLRWP